MTKDYRKSLDIAHNVRKLEINLLWKRAWLFWGFTLAGFVGYSYFYKTTDHQKALLVANFGFISSFIWTLANRGSKFWQDYWDEHIKRIEKKSSEYGFFQKINQPKSRGIWSGVRFSPSRLIIALSDYLTLSWFLILIMQVVVTIRDVPHKSAIGYFAFIMTGFTIGYMILVFSETKSHHDD